MVMSGRHLPFYGTFTRHSDEMTPQAMQLNSYDFMKGRSDVPLILGRLMPSNGLTSTQVLSKCAAMRGGAIQPINFSNCRQSLSNIRNGKHCSSIISLLH